MRTRAQISRIILVITAVVMMVPASRASTFQRTSLESLTARNSTVVTGQVVDIASYWNHDVNFILSDVRLQVNELVKGNLEVSDVVITIPGGTVGDLSTVIVGGASFEIGRSYMVFVDRGDLPGKPNVQTVRDHCQGVFDIVEVDGVETAISQAVALPLLADDQGRRLAPGGSAGLALDTLIEKIRDLTIETVEEK